MHTAPVRFAVPAGFLLAVGIVAAADYEGSRTFKAPEILTAAQIKGPHYEVAPEVPTEGYLHVFQLKTDFGPLEAEGKSLLLLREYETGALAQLDEVSKTGVFVKAAGDSLVKTGKGVAMAVSDPAATAKNMGGGLKRFGSNLGRSAKRTTDKAVESVSGDDKDKKEGEKKADDKSTADNAADAGEGIANSVLGVNGAARRWAQKVGVDPYTTNVVLRKSLIEFGRIDAAGGLAAKIAVPIPPIVGTTATVGNLVWGQDPQALMKRNEQLLTQAGATADGLKRLYLSKGFTLTLMTRFATALGALKAKGGGDYVETAAEADSYREALFFVHSAEMAAQLHKQTPVGAVLTDSRALVAKLADGRAVVVLPVDWIRWTEAFDKASTEVASRAKAELGATKLELRTTAKLSATAKAQLAGRGWAVVEGLPTGFEVMKAGAARPAPKK